MSRIVSIVLLSIMFLSLVPLSPAYAADGVVRKPSDCSESIFTTVGLITNAGDNPVVTASEGIGKLECLAWGTIIFLSKAALLVAAILIAQAGIKYMTAAGAPDAQKKAVGKMNAAIIGFAIVLVIYTLINFFLKLIEYGDFTSMFSG